jgi:hypothetical protein
MLLRLADLLIERRGAHLFLLQPVWFNPLPPQILAARDFFVTVGAATGFRSLPDSGRGRPRVAELALPAERGR